MSHWIICLNDSLKIPRVDSNELHSNDSQWPHIRLILQYITHTLCEPTWMIYYISYSFPECHVLYYTLVRNLIRTSLLDLLFHWTCYLMQCCSLNVNIFPGFSWERQREGCDRRHLGLRELHERRKPDPGSGGRIRTGHSA